MSEDQELLQDQSEGMRTMSREELTKRQADAVRWARNVGTNEKATNWRPMKVAPHTGPLYARDADGMEAWTWHDGDSWRREFLREDDIRRNVFDLDWWAPVEFLDDASMTDKTTLREVGLSEGLGARSRSDMALRALEFVQYVAAVVCVWVTLRTMHPGQIEWWQAAAMGGVSAIVASIFTRRT